MILIDDRIGSKDLYEKLKKRGIDCEITRLEYGDVAFQGRGPQDTAVQIGVEVKTVSDAVDCMQSGRFAGHQLLGLYEHYNYYWLVVEGRPLPGRGGELCVLHRTGPQPVSHGRPISYGSFLRWLISMDLMGHSHVVMTMNRTDTVTFIENLYNWWTTKKFEDHRSVALIQDRLAPMQLTKTSLLRKVAAQLPGVGQEKSMTIDQNFSSVYEFVNARVKDIMELPKFGPKLAQRIYDALRGREE